MPLTRDILEKIKSDREKRRKLILDIGERKAPLMKPVTKNGSYLLTASFGGYKKPEGTYGIMRNRKIDFAIEEGGRRVVSGRFREFRATEPVDNQDLFDDMDAACDGYAAIAMAFISGWDAIEISDYGNIAVLELIASDNTRPAREWMPLLDRFVSERVLKHSFVLLANPYPHDVVAVINSGHRLQEMQTFAAARHEAKFRYFERHLGLERLGDEAQMGHWTYRLRDGQSPPAIPMRFDWTNLMPHMRIDDDDGRNERTGPPELATTWFYPNLNSLG